MSIVHQKLKIYLKSCILVDEWMISLGRQYHRVSSTLTCKEEATISVLCLVVIFTHWWSCNKIPYMRQLRKIHGTHSILSFLELVRLKFRFPVDWISCGGLYFVLAWQCVALKKMLNRRKYFECFYYKEVRKVCGDLSTLIETLHCVFE